MTSIELGFQEGLRCASGDGWDFPQPPSCTGSQSGLVSPSCSHRFVPRPRLQIPFCLAARCFLATQLPSHPACA